VVARTDIWLKAVLIIALTVTLLLGVFAQVFVGPFA
jgi:NADH-quinone oxidoreductase subunit N